jgi:hypothetical protein
VGTVTKIHREQEAVELRLTLHNSTSEIWWFHPKDLTEIKKIGIKKGKFDIKNLVVPL